MRLTFLGTGAGNFRGSRRQTCGALVEGMLLDCGAGTTGRLHDIHLFDRVDAVLISHLHTDHISGLFDFLLHTLITERKRPLTIVSPPGLSPILEAMNRAGAMVRDPAEVYELRLIEALQPEVSIDRWAVRGIPLNHTIYNLGYSLQSDEGTLFYTGDTRPPSAPEHLRAEVVIHESTYADRHHDLAHQFGHSTASEAARAAIELHARHLFLTHLGSLEGTDAEVQREAQAIFGGAIVAEDRMSYDL